MSAKQLGAVACLGLMLFTRAAGAVGPAVPGPYLCYKSSLASGEPKWSPTAKVLMDEFEDATAYTAVKPNLLCSPEPTALPDVFEQGYQIALPKGAARVAPGDLVITDQFGTLRLKVGKADTLLVRAAATDLGSGLTKCKDSTACSGGAQCIDKVCIDPGLPTPPADTAPVDNFKCYVVSTAKGASAFKKIAGGLVQATDPLGGTVSYDVLRPAHLCNPVDKDGENPGAEVHPDRLLCYAVKPTKLNPPQAAFVPLLAATSNTNFPSSRVDVSAPKELCVPARKVLGAVAPFGSLIYASSQSHVMTTPGTTDSFALDTRAGQTLTLVGTPSGGSLALSIEIIDPSSAVIGAATGPSPGVPVVLQTVPAATSGAYTLAVSGVAGATGSYGLQTILNAASFQSDDPLDSFATAFDLSATFTPLGTTPASDRAGVVGTHPTAPGVAQVASFFLDAGQSATIATKGGAKSPPHVELYDGVGDPLAIGAAVGGDIDEAVVSFVAPSSGVYFVLTTGAPATSYALVITRGADFGRHGTSFATAQRLDGTSVVLGGLSKGSSTGDWYQLNVNAGDNLVLTTTTPGGTSADGHQPANDLEPRLNLLDAAGNFVASATGNAADGRNDVINWTALTSGSYRVQVESATLGGSGEYTLAVQGATGGAYPFQVASTKPASGTRLTHTPPSVKVVLDHPVRLDSAASTALVVDGQPATGLAVDDDHTLVFDIPALAPGAHSASVSGLVDLQGTPLTPASFGFRTSK